MNIEELCNRKQWVKKNPDGKGVAMERKFGFFTEALDFECGDIKISTLPEIEEIKKNLTNNYNVYKDILYNPKSQLVTIKENLLDNITEETAVQLRETVARVTMATIRER